MRQAQWMPLGNEVIRSDFVFGLVARGNKEAVRRETDMLLRMSEPGSWSAHHAVLRIAFDAGDRFDAVRSGDYTERSWLDSAAPAGPG